MRHTLYLSLLLILLPGGFFLNAYSETKVTIPRIEGEYVHVYQPEGDIFPEPSTKTLVAGQVYEDWVPNDHCFVRGKDGRWHAFGITHPYSGFEDVHEGENVCFHAAAPKGALKEVLRAGAWKDQPKILPPAERPGDILYHHAPTIAKRDGRYVMIWGPGAPLRYATSKDLFQWKYQGKLPGTPGGRDPSLFYHDGLYYLITCGGIFVDLSTSKDLLHWEKRDPVFRRKDNVDMESPTIVRYNDTFYLFVCGWNHVWDKKDIQGAYQHITYVYHSDDPTHFDAENLLTTINAHAPEIFQDEDGDWYISSVEYPYRGVSIARLVWE